MSTPVEETVNIGTELGKRLRAVGIETTEELLELGDDKAFEKLVAKFEEDACTHTRLALAGAVRGVRWFGLDKDLRAKLTEGLSR
jgi:DNA transformation protein and related proteins